MQEEHAEETASSEDFWALDKVKKAFGSSRLSAKFQAKRKDSFEEFDAQLLFSDFRLSEDDFELLGGQTGPAAESSITLEDWAEVGPGGQSESQLAEASFSFGRAAHTCKSTCQQSAPEDPECQSGSTHRSTASSKPAHAPLPIPQAASNNTADDKVDLRSHITSALLRLPMEYLSRMLFGWAPATVASDQDQCMPDQHNKASQAASPSKFPGHISIPTKTPELANQHTSTGASDSPGSLSQRLPKQLPNAQTVIVPNDTATNHTIQSQMSPAAAALPSELQPSMQLAAIPAGQQHLTARNQIPLEDTSTRSIPLAQQTPGHAPPALARSQARSASQTSHAFTTKMAARKRRQSCHFMPSDVPSVINIADHAFSNSAELGSFLVLSPAKKSSIQHDETEPSSSAACDAHSGSQQLLIGEESEMQTAHEAIAVRKTRRLTGLEVLLQHHQVNSIEEICHIAQRQLSELRSAAKLPEG
ncbi:hypothetical protein WJX74_008058 [Apatococcus lobatus]|uniref:Uncharacterized protein n=1 Tax=Apatococcus lobatus TaxID=904363 RepID=A0AAW1S5N8_9CHLO